MSLPVVMRRIHGKVVKVTPLEISEQMKESPAPRIVDIRPAKSFADGHLPGSENLPVDDVMSEVGEKNDDNDRSLVLVCQSDLQSTRLAAKMIRKGRQNVAVLKGGFFGWKRARLPVERHR